MPIYAYKCASCGHSKDVLQKISDAPLTDCPVCGQSSFSKQLTAAGFQLKGSGWYATDFRGAGASTASKGGEATPSSTDGGTAATPATDAGSTPSTAATTGACGSACACH